MRMSSEMFEALMTIMDRKIQHEAARESEHGAGHEWIAEYEAIEAFKKEFVEDGE